VTSHSESIQRFFGEKLIHLNRSVADALFMAVADKRFDGLSIRFDAVRLEIFPHQFASFNFHVFAIAKT
jgi:hypothetical protein